MVTASPASGPDPKRIVPWVLSIGLHAGLIGLGFLFTWTIMSLAEGEEPVRLSAEFESVRYDPLVTLESDLASIDEPLASQQVATETPELTVAEQLAEMEVTPLSLLTDAAMPPPRARFSSRPQPGVAAFGGLRTTNARRIVYVIDASGSMIRTLSVVLQELASSIEGLSEAQSFGIIFFQRNEAVVVPPTHRLTSATSAAKVRALRWIHENVTPGGRSSPVAAIEHALRLKPEVIFLLSENITGSGQFEVDQEDLLALLERLNPIDPKTGRRATQLKCVQFLYPDPLETLRIIAERHGGAKAYKFIDAAELGIAAP